MPELRFPSDRVVGELDWAGAPIGGVPATGRVVVPDGVRVDLTVPGFHDSPGGGRLMNPAVDLGFVRDLPPDGIEALHIRAAQEHSLGALTHLVRLGLQDVDVTEAEIDDLRRRLPNVDVG